MIMQHIYLLLITLILPTLSTSKCFGGTNDEAYLNWVADTGLSTYTSALCYNASSSSDTSQGVAIHWKLDNENIYIAVAARATGYVGFGLAEVGGMRGADLVIFETANPGTLRDAHVLDERIPVDDTCQDWVFVNSIEDDGFLIFEAYRKLDTMDTQDHKIIDDSDYQIPPQFIIAAWGDTDIATYHGRNTARGSLRWYGGEDELTLIASRLQDQADGSFFMQIPNHTIEAVETDYIDFCFDWDLDLVKQGVPPSSDIVLIAVEMIVTDDARPFFHHAVVTASQSALNQSQTCMDSGSSEMDLGSGRLPFYSWAPGALPFILPENVGYRNDMRSFSMQVHYNNPELIQNVVDSGGLRVYYSFTPREHVLGNMAVADAVNRLRLAETPVPQGFSEFQYECSQECSSLALDEPVTVIAEYFHMHIHGAAAATYHIRNGEIIRQSHVDYYDFDQSGLPTIRQAPFTIHPGDSFVSKFWFNSENGTKFGLSSYEEMNMAAFLYYPAKTLYQRAPWACVYGIPLPACNASMTTRALETTNEFERTFGGVPSSCQIRNEKNTTENTTMGGDGDDVQVPGTTSMGSENFQGLSVTVPYFFIYLSLLLW